MAGGNSTPEDRGKITGDPRFWFQIDAGRKSPTSPLIPGRGLVIGVREEGSWTDARISLAELTARVTFSRRKLRGMTTSATIMTGEVGACRWRQSSRSGRFNDGPLARIRLRLSGRLMGERSKKPGRPSFGRSRAVVPRSVRHSTDRAGTLVRTRAATEGRDHHLRAVLWPGNLALRAGPDRSRQRYRGSRGSPDLVTLDFRAMASRPPDWHRSGFRLDVCRSRQSVDASSNGIVEAGNSQALPFKDALQVAHHSDRTRRHQLTCENWV